MVCFVIQPFFYFFRKTIRFLMDMSGFVGKSMFTRISLCSQSGLCVCGYFSGLVYLSIGGYFFSCNLMKRYVEIFKKLIVVIFFYFIKVIFAFIGYAVESISFVFLVKAFHKFGIFQCF